MQCDPVLSKLLEGLPFPEIDTSTNVILGLSPDLTITYVNQGLSRFAERNGGDAFAAKWSVGCQIMDAIPSVLRPFFQEHFAKVLEEKRPWQHKYECSARDGYRRFVMLSYPLGDRERILVVNSIVQEAPHTGTPNEPIDNLYRNQNGLIVQCSHCRRVRRNGHENQWDMVPAWVKDTPPQTSHGICGPCFSYCYSPDSDLDCGFTETFKTSVMKCTSSSFTLHGC